MNMISKLFIFFYIFLFNFNYGMLKKLRLPSSVARNTLSRFKPKSFFPNTSQTLKFGSDQTRYFNSPFMSPTMNFATSTADKNAIVIYAPKSDQQFFKNSKDVQLRERDNFKFKEFGVMCRFREEVGAKNVSYTYLISSRQLNTNEADQNIKVMLFERNDNLLMEFKSLPLILQHEIIRDVTNIGKFFLKDTFRKPLFGSINTLLDQFPEQLKNYYSNIIGDLSVNKEFLGMDCINIVTSFECDNNNQYLVSLIKTHIIGRKDPNANRDCCNNCQDKFEQEIKFKKEHEKKLQEDGVICLAATFAEAYEGDIVPKSDLAKAYHMLRKEYEQKGDIQSLKSLDEAYDRMMKD